MRKMNGQILIGTQLSKNIKPSTKAKIQRQKVPDDKDIDIDKIA